MGQTGSITQKAYVDPLLHPFTKWTTGEMHMLFLRSQNELPETFALRIAEFEFLLGAGTLVSGDIAVNMFNRMFDTDGNKIVDKFEVLSVICFASGLTNTEKVEWLFDLFNFNSKGYLIHSDMSLLILSVASGICKADKNIQVPSTRQQQLILEESFKFSKVNPGHSLRKPELVKFAAGYREVQLYLDAWRGHGGQVLLAGGEKWRDQFFMADELAIAPSRDWLKAGFPPPSFVRWRRLENVGAGGCHKLFSHSSSFAKTLEKKVLYYGRGLFANGQLVQGFLANRWMLNAFAVCLGRPETIVESFSSTGQESVGRYCAKFYENNALEYWPLVLEKAAAKYFGSYAHIGSCGSRPDASLFALRLLTGGHVIRHNVQDFAWKSSNLDVLHGQRDGSAFISEAFEAGALVAFGRSQAKIMHKSTLNSAPRSAPAHGYLFPLVNISQDKEGWKHLTLRDAFGVEATYADMNRPPDPDSGHCRTFSRKLDAIESAFDTVVVVRFPDSLRYHAEKLRIRQWSTEIVSQYVSTPSNTASFRLTVIEHTEPYKALEGASSNLVGQAAMKAKEIENKRKIAGGKQSYDRFLRSAGQMVKPDKYVVSRDYVDFAFTVSSGCDWIVAGSEKVGAETRLCFTPSEETLVELAARRAVERQALREERRRLAEQERRKKELLSSLGDDTANSKKEAAASAAAGSKPSTAAAGSKPSTAAAGSKPSTAAGARTVAEDDCSREGVADKHAEAANAAVAGSSGETPATESEAQQEEEMEKEEEEEDDFYEYVVTPGDTSAPRGGQYPVTGGSSAPPGVRTRRLKRGVFDKAFVSASCVLSQTVRLWPGEYLVTASTDFQATTQELAKAAKVFDVKDAPWLEHENFASEPKMWLQVSSNNGAFSVARSDTYPSHGTALSSLEATGSVWPFLAESQADVSTRNLVRMLSRLRQENELLGAEALTASKRFLEVYKREETKFFDGLEETKLRMVAEEEERLRIEEKEQKKREKERKLKELKEEEENKMIMDSL